MGWRMEDTRGGVSEVTVQSCGISNTPEAHHPALGPQK